MNSLEGIRVLELGHYIAAPYCSQLLADMGADVIKIERPGEGDAARTFGPYEKGESLYYLAYNRNKRGVSLNLQSKEGKELFLKLVKKADVLVENQRPGFMRKLGFSYEELKEVNPRLVMASISGFGQNGPYKDRPALDMIVQAMGGPMSMTGFPDAPPTKAGFAVVDFTTGIYTALGIMFALYHREKTGKGQFVDVAMLDSVFTLLENFPIAYALQGYIPPRVGNSRVVTGPSNAYKAEDGYVYIAAVADPHYKKLMNLIGRPELASDPEFATSFKRKQAQKFLDPIIENWVSQYTVEEVFKMLSEEGIPAAPVNNIEQLVKDPHIKERDMMVEIEHPTIGKLPLVGNPIKLSDTPVQMRSVPPSVVGQHNQEVLTELLGLSEADVLALQEQNVL